MDKKLPLYTVVPQPDGWVSVHYAGIMGRAKQSLGAWPGTHMSPTLMPTVVWAPVVPLGPQWLVDLSQSGRLCHLQSITRYSFILLSRKRQL